MKEKNITATQLAKDICYTSLHIHKIFHKENIDISLLLLISKALKHDFFKDLSEEYKQL